MVLVLLQFSQTWLLVVAAEKVYQEIMLDLGMYLKLPSSAWAWPNIVDILQKMAQSNNFSPVDNMTWFHSQQVSIPNLNEYTGMIYSQDFASLIYHFPDLAQNKNTLLNQSRILCSAIFLVKLIAWYCQWQKALRKSIACSSVVAQKILICHNLCTHNHHAF